MQISTRYLAAVAVSAATFAGAVAPTFAAPRSVIEIQPQSDVQTVRWVCDRHRNCWEEPSRRQNGFSIQIGPGGVNVGPAYDRREPRRHYGGNSWRAHVNWCMNRYRSYNPHTDTFRTYGGHDRRCHSPYD